MHRRTSSCARVTKPAQNSELLALFLAHDLHGFRGQALELFALALEEPEAGGTDDLTNGSGLQPLVPG
jgi:hypothetical protein